MKVKDMRSIIAPQIHENNVDLFLAGGISNCPEWQDDALDLMSHTDLVVYNPRRSGVLVAEEAVAQIEWEYVALHSVPNILFWFPEETLCPITLYELGVFSHDVNVNLFVGVHPNYQRRIDVITQLRLSRPDVTVYDTLDATVNGFINR